MQRHLKSPDRKIVRVRVPLAPLDNRYSFGGCGVHRHVGTFARGAIERHTCHPAARFRHDRAESFPVSARPAPCGADVHTVGI